MFPGKEEADPLVRGTDPADAVEPEGEDERELGVVDVFVRRWKMVPWLVEELIMSDGFTVSEWVDSCDDPRGLWTILDTRGGGGCFIVCKGFRGVSGEFVETNVGEGRGGNGWVSRFRFCGVSRARCLASFLDSPSL